MFASRFAALLAGIVFLNGCGGGSSGGSSTPVSPTSSTTSASSTPSTPTPGQTSSSGGPTISRYTWASEGVRLDGGAMGFTGAFADSTTIRLNDGRWRMFMFANNGQRSAISSDGLNFTMEEGERVPQGYGHMRVVRAPDGRIRAYNISSDGIVSSVSSDEGLTFTREGFSVTGSAVGFTPSGASVVQMPSGLWRMYFSSLPRPGEGVRVHPVRSAFSSDMVNWTLDAGIRIGTGATLTGSAEHPGAIANPDGSVSLFYFRNDSFKMLMSTARDGLTFTEEFDTGISRANDPDMVRLPDGSVRMYYNWSEGAATGTISSALYTGAAFTASAFAPAAAPVSPAGPAAAQPFWRRFGFTPLR